MNNGARSMTRLSLSVAVGEYDRTRPLSDGTVQIDGVTSVIMNLSPEEIFFRAFRHAEFDICELSLSSFTVKTADGGECLCRRPRLPVAGISAYVDLCPDRPDQDARRPQGPNGRGPGVPVDRKCLGARHPAGRLRGEAVRYPLVAWRHGRRRSARKDRDQVAAGCRASRRPCRQHSRPYACRRRDRRHHSAPGSTLRRAWCIRTSAGYSRTRRLPRQTISRAPASSRSCISLVCVAPWSSSTPGFPRLC